MASLVDASLTVEKTDDQLLICWKPTPKRRVLSLGLFLLPALLVAFPMAGLLRAAGAVGVVFAALMVLVVYILLVGELSPIQVVATRSQVDFRRKFLPWGMKSDWSVGGVTQFQAIFERKSALRYVGGLTDLDAVYADGRRTVVARQLPRFGVTRRLCDELNAFYGFLPYAPQKSLVSIGE